MDNIPTSLRARFSLKAIYGMALFILFAISLALRISLPYGNVFTGGWVRFGGVDPWYHMRLVDNLLQHFPLQIAFDPFTFYPYGSAVPFAPFFDLLLGFFIWVIGLGNPTQYTIETVAAYFPAILGALVTIPVYFIGRELFNRNVGLLSAALIAILPGQFYYRSMLGYTDHHVAEVLFSTTAVLFLILAIKRAKEKEISFSHIRSRDWCNLRKPLIYALLAGLAVGTYLISWSGGLLFLFIIFAYIVIQYIIDHLRGKSTDYLCIIGVPMFLIALIIVIPFFNLFRVGNYVIWSLLIAMLASLTLSGISRLMAYKNIKRAYYPIALAGLGVAGLCLIYFILPPLYDFIVARFDMIFVPEEVQILAESQSLFSIAGVAVLFKHFTINIILASVAFGLIIYTEIKGRSFENTLTFLIIWTLIMLLAMLGQNRFAYYFAVNVALLSGYLCYRIMDWTWGNSVEVLPQCKKGIRKVEKNKEPRRSIRSYISARYNLVAIVAIILLLIVFLPNIASMRNVSENAAAPDEYWHSALLWMKERTPDPFEDPDFYYELYEAPAGDVYDYPESAYGVMAWYHRGYWIASIAHRIPNTNPASDISSAAHFFTAQDESSANEVLDNLGSKYVIIDLALASREYEAVAMTAGIPAFQFYEIYYQRTNEGKLNPIKYYYPYYYQAMFARLYNFNAEAVVPHNSTTVISYKETSLSGQQFKEITGTLTFATYEDAQEYLESKTAPNYRIVSESPFISPIPLEALEHYKAVYSSDPAAVEGEKELISYVKIFEYLP